MFLSLFSCAVGNVDLGLLLLRCGIGICFMIHGWSKMSGGKDAWLWAGSVMKLVGISWAPLFWGLCAACVEFIGGAFLIVGFGMGVVPLFAMFQMIMAFLYHRSRGDVFMVYSQSVELFVVFLALWVTGPGRYSLDVYLCQ